MGRLQHELIEILKGQQAREPWMNSNWLVDEAVREYDGLDQATRDRLVMLGVVLLTVSESPKLIKALDAKRGAPPKMKYRHDLAALSIAIRVHLGKSQIAAIREAAAPWDYSEETLKKDIYLPRKRVMHSWIEFGLIRDSLTQKQSASMLKKFLQTLETTLRRPNKIEISKFTPENVLPRVCKGMNWTDMSP